MVVEQHREALVDAAGRHFTRLGGTWKQRVPGERFTLREELLDLASYLADALQREAPESLARHLSWMSAHLERHGIPAEQLRHAVDALRHAAVELGLGSVDSLLAEARRMEPSPS